MARRMRDILAQRAIEGFVGRSSELAALLHALEGEGPRVVHVHGIAGVGKSSLLEAFSAQARARGATVVRLDCRTMEPTPRGFTYELGSAIGSQARSAEEAAERLSQVGSLVVLALDSYEVYHLMDTWLRQMFIPALRDNVRVMMAGRQPPIPAWLTAPEWEGLFRSISLGPLQEAEALELLARTGVSASEAQRINRLVRGHPLALKLAASSVTERPGLDLEQAAAQGILHRLTQIYLADVNDPLTRVALEAASVVRRANQSLLHAMLPEAAPQDLYDRLRALPFVESARDGLIIHDAVHEVIASTLRASDPYRYREYRRAAWRQLRSEVRTAGTVELWRYTADMLYILENPHIREAFFPSESQRFTVEPARREDDEGICGIIFKHEGPQAAAALKMWWDRMPESFHVVRERDGSVVGLYCLFDPARANPAWMQDDPLARAWWRHLQANPVPRNQQAMFLRRWLSIDDGELPSAVQGACWLDIKRTYMELRPHLRRDYVAVRDIQAYWPAQAEMRFVPIKEATFALDGQVYHSATRDFGPASFDGWLAGMVARELGVVEQEGILDIAARELVMDGERVGLTQLEFGLLHYLYQNEGKAVPRAELVENVWGYDYEGGSNVVDVVVRSLRKKLGKREAIIETVRGVGYRMRQQK